MSYLEGTWPINKLTPRNSVFLGKLKVLHLLKTFPAFPRNQRFITEFTRARHLFLFWTKSIPSMPISHFLTTHFNIILPSIVRSFYCSPSFRFLLHATLLSPNVLHAPPNSFFLHWSAEDYRSWSTSLCSLFHSPVTSFIVSLLQDKIQLNLS
jgi:hypothetical protein